MADESNPQGSQTWYEGLDESLVNDKVKGFTTDDGKMNVAEFLKSYNAAQAYIGGSVKIPTEKSTPEEVAAFYSKLGRPESADKYGWATPEGFETIEDNFKSFKELCFGLGMTDKQVSGVMNGWLQTVKDLQGKEKAELEKLQAANFAALSDANVWGDKAREKIDSLQKKLGAINEGKALAKLQAAGLDQDPDVLLMVSQVLADADGSQISGGGSSRQSKEEEIASLKANPAYGNPNHPDHKKVVERMNELWAK